MHPPAAVGVVTRPVTPFTTGRPTARNDIKTGSVLARYERQFVDGFRGFFRGPPPGTSKCHPRGSQSHKLQGHDPPHRQQEIVRGRASPAYSRRNPPTHGPRARAAELRWTSATRWVCHMPSFPRPRLAIRATCAPVGPGRTRPWSVHPQRSWLVGKAGHTMAACGWNKIIV